MAICLVNVDGYELNLVGIYSGFFKSKQLFSDWENGEKGRRKKPIPSYVVGIVG